MSASPNNSSPESVVYLGYIGGLGGEANQLLDLAAGVASRGIPVRVVVPAMEKVAAVVEPFQGKPNLSIELTPLIRYGRLSQNPLDVLRLVKQCLAPLPGLRTAPVLHIHTGDICLPRLTLTALDIIRPKSPVFATIHCPAPEMEVGGSRARYWAVVASRRLRKVICPSRHGARTQVQYGLPEARVMTIHNGVNTARFATGDRSVPRRLLKVGDETPLIVFTSRLYEQKRPLDTIEAFARIAPEFPEATLAVVGAGPLEEEARARVAALGLDERIQFVGHQSNIPDWLAAATVWLQTSDRENFSLATIEALAAGCPVVATACSGNDEILEDGKNSLTAPVGDIEGLANGLRRLVTDAALRKQLSAGAIKTAACFTRERMVDAHLECYRAEGKA
jgi:glycosyltransferase involved in cell wall biosynthesis